MASLDDLTKVDVAGERLGAVLTSYKSGVTMSDKVRSVLKQLRQAPANTEDINLFFAWIMHRISDNIKKVGSEYYSDLSLSEEQSLRKRILQHALAQYGPDSYDKGRMADVLETIKGNIRSQKDYAKTTQIVVPFMEQDMPTLEKMNKEVHKEKSRESNVVRQVEHLIDSVRLYDSPQEIFDMIDRVIAGYSKKIVRSREKIIALHELGSEVTQYLAEIRVPKPAMRLKSEAEFREKITLLEYQRLREDVLLIKQLQENPELYVDPVRFDSLRKGLQTKTGSELFDNAVKYIENIGIFKKTIGDVNTLLERELEAI